jgi:hypothetical protein
MKRIALSEVKDRLSEYLAIPRGASCSRDDVLEEMNRFQHRCGK